MDRYSLVIEGDISQCFDSLDHEVLLNILRHNIRDGRFLRPVENQLEAGYLEDGRFNVTLSGAPQGGIVSPIPSNIYLDRLHHFVETILLPAYNRGTERRENAAYRELLAREHKGHREEARGLRQQLRQLPSRDPNDPEYRRLTYIRYADDFLLGFNGPRHEAEEIKRQIGRFLHDELKLGLSESKTLITAARTESARFLGYEVGVLQVDHKLNSAGHRSFNGTIGLRVPADVVRAKCVPHLDHGEPIHRMERSHDSPFSIMARYQAEYQGAVEYYRFACNLHVFSRLRWTMERSLTKMLARKPRVRGHCHRRAPTRPGRARPRGHVPHRPG